MIGYVVWPPSASYLYHKAEPLMASAEPSDWLLARDQYLDKLDERFPTHPYREKTEAWRDKIDLRDAERRAVVLEKVNLTGFSKPKTEAEDLYQNMFKESEAALKRKDDREAARLWRTLEKQLTREGRQDRGWALLAKAKAEAVEKVIERRRQTVEGLMSQAVIAPQFANSELARKNSLKIFQDVVNRFGDYPDVADSVTKAKEVLAAEAKQEPAPPPKEPAPKS